MFGRILRRKNMKKLPLTIFPLIAGIVLSIIFMMIPENDDLISATGDMLLGQIIGIALAICLVIDIKKFLKRKNQR